MNAPAPKPTEIAMTIPVGIILTHKKSQSVWVDAVWRVSGVMLDIPAGPAWRELARGDDFTQYLSTRAQIELFRKETEAYIANIESSTPSLYVVLREAAGDEPVEVHLITASPFEAQDYLDTSEETVERVAMPEPLIDVVAAFIKEHHVEETFRKRKRDEVDLEEQKFGKEPIFATRTPMTNGQDHDE